MRRAIIIIILFSHFTSHCVTIVTITSHEQLNKSDEFYWVNLFVSPQKRPIDIYLANNDICGRNRVCFTIGPLHHHICMFAI